MSKRRILLYAKATASEYLTVVFCRAVLAPLIAATKQFQNQRDEVFIQAAFFDREIVTDEGGGLFQSVGRTKEDFVRFELGKGNVSALNSLAALSPENGKSWTGDMSNEAALTDFVAAVCGGRPLTEDDVFIAWGHGGAWRGISRNPVARHILGDKSKEPRLCIGNTPYYVNELLNTEPSSSRLDDAAIQPREMKGAFAGQRPGLIAFVSCLMANLETCYDIGETNAVVVASVDFVGDEAWPLTTWLLASPRKSGKELGSALLSLLRLAPASLLQSISVIESSAVTALAAGLERFCAAALSGQQSRCKLQRARKLTLSFGKLGSEDYAGTVDLGEFFSQLQLQQPNDKLTSEMIALVQSCIVGQPLFGPVYNGRTLSGITVFYPESCAAARVVFGFQKGLYKKDTESASTFIEESSWRDFLDWYWQDKCLVDG